MIIMYLALARILDSGTLRGSFQVHPYHLVEPSPWPLGASIACLTLTSGGVMKFHGFEAGDNALILGLILVLASMALWWRDVIRESTYQGYHTKTVKYGLTLGVILFIVSEIMLFFSIFWAFFHSSLAPTVELGSTWPPVGIEPLNPFEVPALNTAVLLTSGATITVSHAKIISGDRRATILYLILTISLAWMFLGLQWVEYMNAPFTLNDSVYGSSFFFSTGFHGLHVMIGTIFLTVSLARIMSYHLSANHHLGFEAAIWYWHVRRCNLVIFICVSVLLGVELKLLAHSPPPLLPPTNFTIPGSNRSKGMGRWSILLNWLFTIERGGYCLCS